MATPMELDDLRKLTVVKLRGKLSELGLTTSGLKADLVERLHKWYQENADQDDQGDDEGMSEERDTGYHEPPPRIKSPPRGGLRSPEMPKTRSLRNRDPQDSHPPSLMSLPMQEPPQRSQPPPGPPPSAPGPPVPAPSQAVTRTALQLRLQQMAGQPLDDASSSPAPTKPPAQSPAPPPMAQQRPPPPQMGQGPPQRMPPPPGQMAQQRPPPPPQMGQGPPQRMPPPPGAQGPIRPPQGMGPPPPGTQPMPPQQQPLPPRPLGQPPPQQQQMPGMNQPPQMGQPIRPPPGQLNQPPPLMQPPPQMNQQDQDLQEKVAMQTRLLEQERQKQEQQQRMLEQQQKERLAMQQQAMLLQQQNQQGPPSQGPPSQPQPPGAGGPGQGGDEGNTDLMERVRQQQIMLEQQKQKERLEQQQKALIDQQNQAIKKQEEERRRNEAELIRQQRIALREAQREEQQNKMRDDRRGPPPRDMNIPPNSGPPPFNPQPNLISGPRGMMPPPNAGGMRPMMPPHSAPGGMPPPFMKDDMGRGRGPPPEDRGPQEPKEMKLPSALEKVLAFKDVRAQEVGMTPEELEQLDRPSKKDDDEIETIEMEEEDPQEDDDDDVPEESAGRSLSAKESKNKKRKKKKKKRAKKTRQTTQTAPAKPAEKEDTSVVIEYVPEQLELDPADPNYFTFSKIFEAFKITEEMPKEAPKVAETTAQKSKEPAKDTENIDMLDDDDDDMDDKVEDNTPKLSKKKMKKLTRMSVAQLKQQVVRPDLVEMHDVTAPDPLLLVHLKSTRNTVPVPRHWCFKRKYLQGKRGIEKPPFELPDYIQATGITEMRAALAEKEEQKNLKAKMREKVRPKLGKIDIDYQKLHDAFFRFQTKPKMTIHGDLYYEGKEFETRLKEKKPGNLSDDLKTALGMPIGPTSEKVPPPWLIAMQRYGPPPSYPSLKIPGLNAPIPEGCSFGYHAGGWGKPPVDENGKPLYGDVFGTKNADFETQVQEEEIDKSHWGELESESESEEESEEEEEEEMPDETGLVTPAEGLVTPSGITSIPVGMETPDMIELRKKRIEDAMDQGGETPALYQVLPEKKTAVGGAMMGSAHIYDVAGVPGGAKKPGDKVSTEGIEVALNPEELDLDSAAMQAKYDQTLREQQSQLEKEDLSDMVAEHAAKQKKRKKKQEDSGKAAKKYKEFKF